MAACNAYHSTRVGGPKVYHTHDDCWDGNNIEDRYFAWGTGGHPICKTCIDKTRASLAAFMQRRRRLG